MSNKKTDPYAGDIYQGKDGRPLDMLQFIDKDEYNRRMEYYEKNKKPKKKEKKLHMGGKIMYGYKKGGNV